MKKFLEYKLLFLLLIFTTFLAGQQGQINIYRIESMPHQPEPYLMRDWKQVAIKYDSFIYDSNKSGTFLPLISLTYILLFVTYKYRKFYLIKKMIS
jgi:hypothetical protein